ncbi:MAG TPA: deoxyribonuclease V [Candidatus Polarisedimenticolaceae bacterium]|nr:deoxyribonuclease V [Candidatus Polarisedimenticolaceae bacterium]
MRRDLRACAAWQAEMRARVERHDRLGPVRRVAGADVAYARSGRALCAAVVVLDARTLEVVGQRTAVKPVTFPYVPGFLTLREAPAVEEAFSSLRPRPDLLLVDAHGVAHPRGFGLACHLGVALDVPTIGVAKTVLVGAALPPGLRRGDRAPLLHGGDVVGAALRTREGVAPIYVSTGHRVSLSTALRWTLALAPRFRLPEPARRAHAAATSARALLP